jgi:hypothetical protein
MPSGRGAGTGKNMWQEFITPGGITYWTRSDDPGFGYVDDPDKAGEQPEFRYPISLIDYLYSIDVGGGGRYSSTETKAGQQVRELTATALEGRVQVPYGTTRFSGNMIAWRASGYQVWSSWGLGHGPISGVPGINILGQNASLVAGPPFNTYLRFQFDLGLASPAGAVPSYYQGATGGLSTQRHPYLAMVHCQMDLNPDGPLREFGVPLATVNGRTLRDPRLGVDGNGIPDQPEAFSKNVALALADYYTSSIYGLGVDDDRINWDSVADTADYCDVLVAGLPRHTINWAIMRTATQRDIIDTIKALGRIRVLRRDGKRVFVPEKAASRVFVFTPDNSRPIDAEVVSLATAPNIVKNAFTNPSKNWGDDSRVAKTEDARTGAEPPYPAEIHFEGTTNASEAQRQADFALLDGRNPLRVTLQAVTSEGALQFEPMDRVGYYSPTAKLGVSEADPQDLRILRAVFHKDGTTDYFCKQYDVNAMSDAISDTEAEPINTTPPPTDPPDPPTSPTALPNLYLGDGMTQSLPTSVLVEWTHPGWPYDLRYKITKESSAAGSVEIVVHPAAIQGPVLVELDLMNIWTIRVYAFIVATGVMSSALAGVCEPAVDFNFPVAEWPRMSSSNDFVFLDANTHKPMLRFRKAPVRSRTLYGAADWSQVGVTSWDAGLINNGSTAALAAVVNTGDTMSVDLGAAKKIREVRVSSANTNYDLELYDSDDGVSYSYGESLFGKRFNSDVTFSSAVYSAFVPRARFFFAGDRGLHEWLRLAWTVSSAGSSAISEIQLYEYLQDDHPTMSHYNVYTLDTNGAGDAVETLRFTIPYSADLEAVPIDLSLYAKPYTLTPGDLSDYYVHIRVRGVDIFGSVSEPLDIQKVWNWSAYPTSSLLTRFDADSMANKEIGDASNTIGGVSIGSGATLVKDTDVALAANSDSNVATQKAVKAYVDALAALGIEVAQDAVGAMLVDTATIDFTYSDATPSLTADVKDDSITFAKMANLATDRLIGRDTASTGDPEALTVGGGVEFTGAGGIQTSAFTGDVTKAAGGTATTIANDAVTYAKMQNVSATDKILGRATAGFGDVEEITCTAAGRAILDDVDATAQRATLGLGTMATQAASAVAITGGSIAGVTAGGGAATLTPDGVITRTSVTTSTTAVVTEEDLWSYSLPAATMTAAGSAIRVTAFGRFAGNTNVKTVRFYFGAHVAVLNFTTTSPNGVSFRSLVIVSRVNATGQFLFRDTLVGAAQQAMATSTPGETLANAITVKITGQNGTAAAGDITLDRVLVEYL